MYYANFENSECLKITKFHVNFWINKKSKAGKLLRLKLVMHNFFKKLYDIRVNFL